MRKCTFAPAGPSRLDRFRRRWDICLVEGIWRAWLPDGAGGGTELDGLSEDELVGKLTDAEAAGVS